MNAVHVGEFNARTLVLCAPVSQKGKIFSKAEQGGTYHEISEI
jgi:hypothetical protein